MTCERDTLLVRVRNSKTDQTGAGAVVPIKLEASEDCYDSALALAAWLVAAPAGDAETPLFPSLHGTKTGAPFSGSAVAELIQSRCRKAGLKGDFSGHSLRCGWIQSAKEQGTPDSVVQQVTRQKTAAMIALYCETQDKRRVARRLRDGQ